MIPKKINKMSIEEQEVFLVTKLQELHIKESIYRRALAKVRGKHKLEVSDQVFPNLLEMKDEVKAA